MTRTTQCVSLDVGPVEAKACEEKRLAVTLALILMIALSLFSVSPAIGSELAAGAAVPSETAASLLDQWGVRVFGIRRTAAGYMLDFRYRVVDPVKAAPLLEYRIKPYVVAQQSGAKLVVPMPPKIGSLRNTTEHVEANRNYFALFANPGRHVKAGDKVAVVIGDFKVENLVVE